MSTFAGVLIIVSSSLVRDVYRNGLGRRLTGEQEVFYNRIVSAAVGLISLAIALKPPALILVLTGFSWAVIASPTLWPLLFGIYWRRASRLAAIGSMVVGSFTAILWTWLGKPFGVHGFIAGSAAALVAIVALSFARKWEPPAGHLERIFDGETTGGQ